MGSDIWVPGGEGEKKLFYRALNLLEHPYHIATGFPALWKSCFLDMASYGLMFQQM